ncbi:Tetratricopeptide repeat,Tetratricopeptide repeat-containing domain,Tetratricopeptide-like helical [Cinara cedri]|uniref:Tetratricopeptide repeat,Tetratricopeptide repeat-containing domain,Tetratricopeptide-like helical n=1 Tax=Cinara cedri TaxID=506608 RepID=A0A5E4MBV8_9HEMI|nr:Tetratricopeptide repeat,Tetratricopeptide repeat-containing domain,Tetratricopeptide-like helical [Cinara cedri]
MMNEPASQGNEHFSIQHERFRNTLNASDLDEFSNLPDDNRRIHFVYKRLYANLGDPGAGDDEGNSKNGDKALEMKKTGTVYFQKSDYRNAVNWYSLALLNCPQTEDWLIQLSIIYANRSACLYRLEDYDRSISDIQRALDNGYPKNLRYKVYDRRARCFLATKQLKSALESFKATIEALDDSGLSLDERRKRQLDMQVMLTMMAKDKNLKNEPKAGDEPTAGLYGRPNDAYPAASDAVSIEYAEAEGRHAVASRDVPVGSVLLVERAYASVLLREYCHTHCTDCFAKLVAPVPCPGCNRVAFCGDRCKRVALKSYHAIECPLLPTLFATGVSITCLIALRIITQQPLRYFVDLQPKLNHMQTPCGKREPEKYVNLYNLVTHRRLRSVQDILHRTHVAAFYLYCLKKTNYFAGCGGDIELLTDDQLFIGSLLLHHLLLIQFNAFEVSELRLRRAADNENQETVFIGGSVYPTLALLNHSCDPCVVRYHRGTSVIVQNIRDLCVGEAITENYGPMFMFQPKKDRQETLKTRYWFECNCIACCQDWPTWEQMKVNTSLRIRCKNCKNAITVTTESMEFIAHCRVCLKTTNLMATLKVLQDTEKKYKAAKGLMDKHNYKKALKEFMALLSLLHKHLVPPFRDYHLCQQAIRECILSFGNKS